MLHADTDIKDRLQNYLQQGETLLWTGRPKGGIRFQLYDVFLIPFSLMWCAFAIFWVKGAAQASGPFALFGVPFVAFGLFFVFGRFILDAKQRAATVYGITEDRIIILSGILSREVKSVQIRTLSNIEYTEKADGSGTLTIGPRNPMSMWGNGMNWWPGVQATPALDLIEDVGSVYNRIVALQNAAKPMR